MAADANEKFVANRDRHHSSSATFLLTRITPFQKTRNERPFQDATFSNGKP